MKFTTSFLLSTTLVLLTACEATRTSREATNIPSVASDGPRSLPRELTQGPYRFDIKGGNGSNPTLTVRTSRDGHRTGSPLKVAIAGQPTQALATDLDGDGQPELLFFSRTGGPNEGFYGYELEPGGFRPLAGPGPVGGPAAHGYTGPDAYTVSGLTLVRSFALANTTAASRTITYRLLPTHQWRVRQVMDEPR